MKTLKYIGALIIMMAIVQPAFAQHEDQYEVTGKDQVTVTRYYDDGAIREIGVFTNGTPNGRWVEYNRDGKLKTEATYVNGKKEGKWFVYSENGEFLYELFYEDNRLTDANRWKIEERNAIADN